MGNRRMASYGAFRGGQQRLTLQSEAVAALRGEDFENRIIMEHFTEFRARTSALFWEYCTAHASSLPTTASAVEAQRCLRCAQTSSAR